MGGRGGGGGALVGGRRVTGQRRGVRVARGLSLHTKHGPASYKNVKNKQRKEKKYPRTVRAQGPTGLFERCGGRDWTHSPLTKHAHTHTNTQTHKLLPATCSFLIWLLNGGALPCQGLVDNTAAGLLCLKKKTKKVAYIEFFAGFFFVCFIL